MRDSLYDSALCRLAIPFDVLDSDGAVNGTTIDKAYLGNMFRTVMFTVVSGDITDGTFAITIQDSDNGSDWTNVADSSYVQGSLPTITDSDGDKTYDIGYTGPKRYVRLVATVADTAESGGLVGAVAYLSQPRRTPVVGH